nr:MAG TPA: hypothetical protein [Bacteriophage sp.]
MKSSRVSEIAALGFKTLESGKKISPRAYETVGSAEIVELALKVKELEEEVLRLRQQRDAANATLSFVLEKLSEE